MLTTAESMQHIKVNNDSLTSQNPFMIIRYCMWCDSQAQPVDSCSHAGSGVGVCTVAFSELCSGNAI